MISIVFGDAVLSYSNFIVFMISTYLESDKMDAKPRILLTFEMSNEIIMPLTVAQVIIEPHLE